MSGLSDRAATELATWLTQAAAATPFGTVTVSIQMQQGAVAIVRKNVEITERPNTGGDHERKNPR